MTTDDQIIRNIISGEQHAFRVLVNEYEDLVFTMCYRILAHRHLAEEAAQDVFVKVYRKLHLFDQRSSLKTWIYRIAYRTAIDHQRKKRVRTIELEKAPMVADSQDDAQVLMERSDEQQRIRRGLAQLKTIDATLINLYYMEGQSMEEISEITKLSKSNVKVRLHRARHKLAEILSRKQMEAT